MQPSSVPDIPGLEILERLGEGGMGTVYRARQTANKREVAIKFLTAAIAGADEENRSRFQREARVMQMLTHENIVGVIDHGSTQGRDYLVMEYVKGSSLREVVAQPGPTPIAETLAILAEVAAALTCLHEQGIVHRDLKPGNILINEAGRAKLTDFGISSPVAELGDITATNQFVGSLDYMAPEQRTRLPVDQRADQFALAVIAYELLVGKRPVGTYKAPSKIKAHLHRAGDEVIARALEEDPDDRFDNVQLFVDELTTALTKPSQGARTALVVSGCAALLALIVWAGARMPHSPAGNQGIGAATPTVGNEIAKQLPSVPAVESALDPSMAEDPDTSDDDERIDTWVAMSDRRLAEGKYIAATQAITEAIRLSEDDASLYHRRALVHKLNGMFQLALTDLEKTRQLDPGLVDAWIGAASIHINLLEYPVAIDLLDQAIAKNPMAAPAFAWRGWAQHGLRRDKLALRDLEQAIKLDCDCGIAHQWRGILAKQRKDWAAVVRDYSAFARCNPEDPYAHRALASFLALCPDKKFRNAKLAVHHAQRACELTQWRSWEALRVLASAYNQAGDVGAAIETLDKALAHAPENKQSTLKEQKNKYEQLQVKKR